MGRRLPLDCPGRWFVNTIPPKSFFTVTAGAGERISRGTNCPGAMRRTQRQVMPCAQDRGAQSCQEGRLPALALTPGLKLPLPHPPGNLRRSGCPVHPSRPVRRLRLLRECGAWAEPLDQEPSSTWTSPRDAGRLPAFWLMRACAEALRLDQSLDPQRECWRGIGTGERDAQNFQELLKGRAFQHPKVGHAQLREACERSSTDMLGLPGAEAVRRLRGGWADVSALPSRRGCSWSRPG